MSKSNIDLMRSARESLKGYWGLAIGTFLVYGIITGSLQRISQEHPYAGIVYMVIAGPLFLGIHIFSLKIARNKEARFEQLLEGFNHFTTSIVAYFLMILFVFLWMLLLIIPGIIAAISYSMTFFIIADHEQIEPMEALNKSKEMMNGYKLKMFYLGLRFFGLGLLCILTLGIGFLWLIPYINVVLAKFYDDIKNNSTLEIY